ncbi:MAG: hypothetical protein LBD54_02245 [Puniceicoccales bacterium]|jgi:hypothetical protein|nr:hypothetical protein [Puniceicoccales bacterium]
MDMDNEEFLRQSEEYVASVRAAIERAKRMIERAESVFRHFGFARGNDEAMFAMPFIQKMADDIALIAKGEQDYLEFMGFKEPKGGWPTLHLGIANPEDETAIDRLLAAAQAVPLKPRKEFFQEEAASIPSDPRESTVEAMAHIRTQMDALLASSKAAWGARNVIPKKATGEKAKKQSLKDRLPKPSPTSLAAMPIIPMPKPVTDAALEQAPSKNPPPEDFKAPVVPAEVREMLSTDAEKKEESEPIALVEASSQRVHRRARAQALRSRIRHEAPSRHPDGDGEGKPLGEEKSLHSDAGLSQQNFEGSPTASFSFKADTQISLPQSSSQNPLESLPDETPSAANSAASGYRKRPSKTRLLQDGDKLRVQKKIQL